MTKINRFYTENVLSRSGILSVISTHNKVNGYIRGRFDIKKEGHKSMKKTQPRKYRDITERYCSGVDDNVIVERHSVGDHDEFTCLSHSCGLYRCIHFENNISDTQHTDKPGHSDKKS